MRPLVVSFGGAHMAHITEMRVMSWEDLIGILLAPMDSEDKAAAGWYSCGQYAEPYRDSDNLQFRHALAFDFDHVTPEQLREVQVSLKGYAYVAYTTASHTPENPRVRMVFPTSRPMTPDEYCAVSRKVASLSNIEYASRESHVPAQFMFLPTIPDPGRFKGKIYRGAWIDVDAILATYKDWRNKDEWPHRAEADSVHHNAENITPPNEKPGLVGAFCRAYSVEEAIEEFDLPYDRVR